MMDIIKPNKKYVYVRYCIDQLKLIRNEIIGLEADYPGIWDYIDDAKSIIANRFEINIEDIIIIDYKYFGSELVLTNM